MDEEDFAGPSTRASTHATRYTGTTRRGGRVVVFDNNEEDDDDDDGGVGDGDNVQWDEIEEDD